MTAEPHWERGHRCHGLWLGETRIGLGVYDTVIRFVSSEVGTKVKLDEYNYAVDVRLAAERARQAGGDDFG